MKKNISIVTLLSGFALLVAGAFILSSCEGPAGPPGLDGADGADGIDGVDANATCIVCHNAEVVLLAKQQQAASSHHLTGGTYERSHADCAICHTHQGFIETIDNGALEASADIVDPAPINCRTCHTIHNNYDETDWALTTSDAVDLDFGGVTIDLGGSSNLCVNCHQFRPVSPMPEMGGANVTITNSRWGPHHGPHANNLWGTGGYLVAGTKSYPTPGSHPHAGAGCVACHMAPVPYSGKDVGGHTFNMQWDDGDYNTDACIGCHSTIEDYDGFDYKDVQTEVEELLEELKAALVAKGYLDETSGLWKASSGTPLVVTADEAGAMLNFLSIEEDRSKGVHNPPYIIALLTNSIEALQ